MSQPKYFRLIPIFALALTLLAVWPSSADAQRRRVVRAPAVRSVVVIGGFSYPRYGFYSPFFYDRLYDPWYQWGPYPPYGPYGRYSVRDDLTSSLRLQVTPRDTQVIVDGYSAGTVDDFDGVFQRLRLRPGNHEIAFYLSGYHTIRQHLYLSPGADQKILEKMEPLAPGDEAEPPPQPAPAGASIDDDGAAPLSPPMPGPSSRPGSRPGPSPNAPSSAVRFGTLSIRVQPADANVLIDGERWAAPTGQERIAIQLSEGRHHIEVRKDGFAVYTEDVLIRRENTMTLNVSLTGTN